MKRKVFKKVTAVAAALLLTIGSALPAFAADVKPVEAESTITLHLYGSNGTSNNIGTGTTSDGDSLPTGAEPIKDATFRYAQIGNVVQYNNGQTAEIRYQITNENFAKEVGITATNSEMVDGTSYIIPDYLLQTLLTNANGPGNVETFIARLESICKNETTATTEMGETKVENCSGLYVFIGGQMPDSVVSHVTPFLVSAPMPNLDGAGWNQDIHVYPKVADNEMTLEKKVKQGDVDEDRILVQSGKEMEYTVTLTVPGKKETGALVPFEKFVLKDTMAAGLQPVPGGSSLVVTSNGAPVEFHVKDGEIKVTPPSNSNKYTTEVTFLEAGLKKLNDVLQTGDAVITLKYQATLGNGATLGMEGNANNAQLVYQRTGGKEGILSAMANVHTYGIDVTKELSDGTAVGSNEILFKLTWVEGEKETEVKFSSAHDTSGGSQKITYWVDEDNADASATLKVAPDGKLRMYGLLPGTYKLEETKSAGGYSKLDQPILIVITPPENAQSYGNQNATATADGQAMLTDASHAFQLTVVNVSQKTGFTLPKTGGEGMLLALVVGFGLVGFAVLVLAGRRKSNNG